MEDIYDDLENYQHENVVSELRTENQELKCKLEEYATTLASLQKEFDKLSEEYKKLELNYSSLLKTARAEIERKSQMITNLNLEKDQLVINSIQNTGRLPKRKANVNNKEQKGKQLVKENESTKEGLAAAVDAKTLPNSTDKNVPDAFNHNRKDKYNKITGKMTPSFKNDTEVKDKDLTSKKSEVFTDKDNTKNEIRNRKENDSDVFNNAAVGNKVSKIKNRRKSMPLLKQGDYKFSSDEEQNEVPKDHHFRKKSERHKEERDMRKERDKRDCRLEIDRIHHDHYRNGRYDPERKIAEHTRMGDKHVGNYDSTRDGHRKTNSRYRESDRHRSRDNKEKYESSQRPRRYYSPDRQYDIQGEYFNKQRETNDRPHWTDNARHRTLVSPPPEKYNPYRRSREFDSQRLQHEGMYPVKHKIHDVSEEPPCKRLRIETLNKPTDKHIMPLHNQNVEGRATSLSRPLELSYLSLQSPDYLENNPPVHQVKEIKGTSDLKLDDPRLTSKKYTVTTNRDHVMLSTVVGRDVDVKPIDTSTWEIDKEKFIPEMPTPLKEKPPITEDFVKDVYMDIDNPMSNLSLESGEIYLEEEMDNVDESAAHIGTVTVEDSNNKCMENNIQSINQFEDNKKEPIDNTQKSCPTVFSKNYRIPKVKKSNIPILSEDDSINTVRNKLSKKDTKHSHKKKNSKSKRDQEKKLKPETNNYNSLKMFSDAVNFSKSKSHKSVDVKHRKPSTEKAIISARDTVEGDLELSDETCDYVEVSDQTRYDKDSNTQKLQEFNKDAITGSVIKDLITGEPEKSDWTRKERTEFEHGIKEYSKDKQFNLLDNDKGRDVQPKETFIKTFDQQKPKDIKSKLCDLFGDTSSLITLDDLGIAASTTTKENLNEYAPLFENTQDAVDLNVEEMEKVQTRSMKLLRNEDEPDKNSKVISEIRENKIIESSKQENQKFDNSVKSSSLQHIFENVNAAPEDSSVVKTVIISSGIQNHCHSVDTGHDGKQNKQIKFTETTSHDNVTHCPALLSIKALATSTPHKPSLSVPEISCSSNNSAVTKDTSSISSKTGNSKVNQSNTDIPDVRIIVKRRRKTKGPS